MFLALSEAAVLARAGERDPAVLVATMAREIGATPLARPDYAAVIDDRTFEPVTEVHGPSRAIVAVRFPSARLIDNLLLPEPVEGRPRSDARAAVVARRPVGHDAPMLLAADVGNTEIVLGVFDDAALLHTWRVSTQPERTSDELALMVSGLLAQRGWSFFDAQITGFVVASVVPDVTQAIRELADRYLTFPPVIVGPGTKTGVPVLTDNPREVGADRVVNALAAFTRFGGPVIVVDFGTGTNFDIVSGSGNCWA